MRKLTVAFICIAVSTVFFSQTAEARTRAYVSIGTPGFCIEASNMRCYPHRTWIEGRYHGYGCRRAWVPGHWAYAPAPHRYYARAHHRHLDRYYRHRDRCYWQDRDDRGSRSDWYDRDNDSPREPRRDRDPGRT